MSFSQGREFYSPDSFHTCSRKTSQLAHHKKICDAPGIICAEAYELTVRHVRMLKTNLGKAETDPVGSARVPHAVPWPREGTNDEI